MFSSVFSGAGFWDAGVWLLMFVFVGGYAFGIRRMGRSDYKKGTDQDEVYYSGNVMPDVDVFTVPASSSYWGFREALKGYYSRLSAMHTGIATEYVGWFVLTAAVILVLVIV
ncbi:MAG: hydrogenase [Pyramidobacter sp.]|jgi:hypothetical protein|nr:hydrogenase [Pyramidobacter sp.]MBP3752296.1 hydrogenase [Pyramidobacter sp.]MBP3835678.1 hydrogenase [Pyramidobacter sp.]MBP3848195.1 hydrogenase [Pyramidobacter sp.]MBQ4491250.1 hydrogenase [Pyramidobacter sp.]